MGCSIGMHMDISSNTAGRLSFENAIEGRSGTLGKIQARCYAAIVCNHNILSVLVQYVHRDSIEQVAILLKHVCFWAFTYDRRRREYQYVLHLFDRNMKSYALARTETPNSKDLAFLFVGT